MSKGAPNSPDLLLPRCEQPMEVHTTTASRHGVIHLFHMPARDGNMTVIMAFSPVIPAQRPSRVPVKRLLQPRREINSPTRGYEKNESVTTRPAGLTRWFIFLTLAQSVQPGHFSLSVFLLHVALASTPIFGGEANRPSAVLSRAGTSGCGIAMVSYTFLLHSICFACPTIIRRYLAEPTDTSLISIICGRLPSRR